MNKHTTHNQLREQIALEVDQLLDESPEAKTVFRKHAGEFKALHDEWKESQAKYEAGEAEFRPEDPARWEIEDKTCCHFVTAGVIRDTVVGARRKPLVGDLLGQDDDDHADAFKRVSLLICRNQTPYGMGTLKHLMNWIRQDLYQFSLDDIPALCERIADELRGCCLTREGDTEPYDIDTTALFSTLEGPFAEALRALRYHCPANAATIEKKTESVRHWATSLHLSSPTPSTSEDHDHVPGEVRVWIIRLGFCLPRLADEIAGTAHLLREGKVSTAPQLSQAELTRMEKQQQSIPGKDKLCARPHNFQTYRTALQKCGEDRGLAAKIMNCMRKEIDAFRAYVQREARKTGCETRDFSECVESYLRDLWAWGVDISTADIQHDGQLHQMEDDRAKLLSLLDGMRAESSRAKHGRPTQNDPEKVAAAWKRKGELEYRGMKAEAAAEKAAKECGLTSGKALYAANRRLIEKRSQKPA